MQDKVRNFCIIAHIDHGKSTLADRFLEFTETVSKREMKDQLLDQMDLERERGITIKLQPVHMKYKAVSGEEYTLNLIDTPGHVDFTYEVSRSLAAVEGAVLLVDATQGVQAQTIANLYLAIEQNLTIIPVVNKIDMPNADRERTVLEIMHVLGVAREEILFASGRTGEGVAQILEAVIQKVPAPKGDVNLPLRALIFDSTYDSYKGVIAFLRIIDGKVASKQSVHYVATGANCEVLDVGSFRPKMVTESMLVAGDIGYIVTGLKDISSCRVGDTVTIASYKERQVVPLAGYKDVVPMVFAGIFPKEGDEFEKLRESMLRLKLNDSSLTFEPEHSAALGFGFRTGMLGLLHLEIVQERLRREYGMEVVLTTPSVAYQIIKTDGEQITVKSPQGFLDPSRVRTILEPWVTVDVIAPKDFLGGLMSLMQEKRGLYQNTEYLMGSSGDSRIILHYQMPLSSILVDFYDKLKSASSGYASLNYQFCDYRPANVVKMDILVADTPAEALATIVYVDEAESVGRRITASLKDSLPRQQFEVKIQAAIGSKIVASERLKAFRKDVIGGLSGGDASRKSKLLEKQKKGKKRMAGTGKVDIPPEAYLSVLKRK